MVIFHCFFSVLFSVHSTTFANFSFSHCHTLHTGSHTRFFLSRVLLIKINISTIRGSIADCCPSSPSYAAGSWLFLQCRYLQLSDQSSGRKLFLTDQIPWLNAPNFHHTRETERRRQKNMDQFPSLATSHLKSILFLTLNTTRTHYNE